MVDIQVESPGFDNGRGKYPQFADCKWTLEGPQGTNIVLQVHFFIPLPHPVYRKRSPNHCNIYPVILGCVQCTMYMKEILLKNCQVMTTVLILVIGAKYGQTISVGYKLKNPTKQ